MPTIHPNSGARWWVTSQEPYSTLNPGGRFDDGYLIRFATYNGHSGQVFVPNSIYAQGLDAVRPLVEQHAQTVIDAGNLSG